MSEYKYMNWTFFPICPCSQGFLIMVLLLTQTCVNLNDEACDVCVFVIFMCSCYIIVFPATFFVWAGHLKEGIKYALLRG